MLAVAAPDPVARFRFDLEELKRPLEHELHVIASTHHLPDGAAEVFHPPRPQWLPPLLPVFAARRPLWVAAVAAGAPTWRARLLVALATLIAMASEPCAVRVLLWADGFAAGPPGFCRLPPDPAALVIAAECERTSIALAAGIAMASEFSSPYLALHGDIAALDLCIGLDEDLHRRVDLVRFPMLGPRDVGTLAGRPPRLVRGRFSRTCLGLAGSVVRRYRESES